MLKTIHNTLKIVKEIIYDKCGFVLTDLSQHKESIEYEACSFMLNNQTIQYRVSKITPTKNGQFVTIWKRNKDGQTEPFDISDNIDFVIITSKKDNQFGQFIFPKTILVDKGIFSKNGKSGKRGIRVYPPWDIPTSKQAAQTKKWQLEYFLDIEQEGLIDFSLVKNLFAK